MAEPRADILELVNELHAAVAAGTDVADQRSAAEAVLAALDGPAPRRPYLDHVGIIVSDLAAAVRTFGDVLGGKLIAGGTEYRAQVRSAFLAFPGGGKVELLQPVGQGPMMTFLEKRGEGVHHLTVVADDIVEAQQRSEGLGVATTGLDTTDPEWQEVYLRPKAAQGCLVQIVDVPDSYDIVTPGITLAEVLADTWEWVDRKPRRKVDA